MKVKTTKQRDSRLNEAIMKNVKKKKRLSEGAGAGYTIESTITFDKLNAAQTKIIRIEYKPDAELDSADFTIEFDCKSPADVDIISAESYYYGFNDTRIEDAPAEVTKLIVDGSITPSLSEAEFKSLVNKNLNTIAEYLGIIKIDNKILIGRGDLHTTFDGVVMRTTDKPVSYDDYFPVNGVDLEIDSISADVKLTDTDTIKYIDRAVTGNNLYTEYTVYDADKEPIGDNFDDEDDAVKFAKDNNGSYIIAYYLQEMPNGDIDTYDYERVWTVFDENNKATLGEDIENLTSLVDGKDDFGVEPTTAFTPSTSDAIRNHKRTTKLIDKNFKAQRDITGKFVKDQNKRTNRAKTEDIKIVSEIALEDFEFWRGAKYVADKLSHDDFIQIEDYLNEISPDGMTKTEVNDFFWFEDDTIAEILGYDSWEDLEEKRENEDDEDDIDEALSPTAITLATTLGTEIIKNPEVLDKLGNLVKTISDASPISKAIEAIKGTK